MRRVDVGFRLMVRAFVARIVMVAVERVLDMLGLPAQRGLPKKVRKISRQRIEAGQQRRERAEQEGDAAERGAAGEGASMIASFE